MYYQKYADLQINRSTFYYGTEHHYFALFYWWSASVQLLKTHIFVEIYFLIHQVYISVKYYLP